jgi:hypothetical protein
MALTLAGAGSDAPPFADAALLVARAAGWDPAQLAAAEALEVDRLAAHLGSRPLEPQWNSLLLARGPDDELAGLRAELADDLLRRAQPAQAEQPEASGSMAQDGAATLPERGERHSVASAGPFAEQGSASAQPSRVYPISAAAPAPRADTHSPAQPPREAAPSSGVPVLARRPLPIEPAGPSSRRSYARVRGSVGLGRDSAHVALASRAAPEPAIVALPDRLAQPAEALPQPPTAEIAAGSPQAWSTPDLGAGAVAQAAGRPSRSALAWEDSPRLDTAGDQLSDLADALAALLDDEADLRGIAR